MSNEPYAGGGTGDQYPPENGPEKGHELFSWIRSLEIHRPDGAWLGGVFSALSSKLNWDAALVRGIGVVALILFTSPVLLFYGTAWLFLPDARGSIHAQQALRGHYTSGLWGGAIIGFLGAINVFTPNVAGPFAIVLNAAVIGLVAWLLYVIFRGYRRDHTQEGHPKAQTSGSKDPSGQTADQKRTPQRADGRPAWFPKDGPEGTPQDDATTPPPADISQPPSRQAGGVTSGYSAHASSSPVGGAAHTAAADSYQQPASPQRPNPSHRSKASAPSAGAAHTATVDPRERDERRRRRMISFGLLLLALPVIAAAVWLVTLLGLPTSHAVLLGLATVVTLLAFLHIGAALRGRKGRPVMLGVFTTLMVVVFLASSNTGGSSNYVLGNYTTSNTDVNTALANSTVDLRDLSFSEEDAIDLSESDAVARLNEGDGFHSSVDVNNAFGNTTVVVPDDVYIEVEPNNLLGNIDIHTTEVEEGRSGISSTRFGGGPSEPVAAVELIFNNAFGNVTVYDETTYEQEELGESEGAEAESSAIDTDATTGSDTAGASGASDVTGGSMFSDEEEL